MTTVTSEAVWRKVNEDTEFQQQPEPVREAMRPLIEALPAVLADFLDKPATLSNTMQAKVKFLRYCVDNGFIKVVVAAMPDDVLGFFDREDLSGMFEWMLSGLIEMAEGLASDMETVLEANGVTEDQVMLGPNVGLNPEARSLYQAGKLTIGRLLLIQPMIFVNTK